MVKASKAVNWAGKVSGEEKTRPPQKSGWVKTSCEKAVTMPKLFEPPLRASQRSRLEVAVALTICPDARTT